MASRQKHFLQSSVPRKRSLWITIILQITPLRQRPATRFRLRTEVAKVENTIFLHRFHVPREDLADDRPCAANGWGKSMRQKGAALRDAATDSGTTITCKSDRNVRPFCCILSRMLKSEAHRRDLVRHAVPKESQSSERLSQGTTTASLVSPAGNQIRSDTLALIFGH